MEEIKAILLVDMFRFVIRASLTETCVGKLSGMTRPTSYYHVQRLFSSWQVTAYMNAMREASGYCRNNNRK